MFEHINNLYDYYSSSSLNKIYMAGIIMLLTILLSGVPVSIATKIFNRISNRRGGYRADSEMRRAIRSSMKVFFISIGFILAVRLAGVAGDWKWLTDMVFRILIIYSIFRFLYGAADVLVEVLCKVIRKSEQADAILVSFLIKSVRVFIFLIAATIITQELGYDVTGIVAGLGVGGLAVALAAKDALANLFGSMTIMFDKPFVVGDLISTPHGEGMVEDVGFRSTRIRTTAQAVVTIPNSVMSNDAITNLTRMEKRMSTFKLFISHDTQCDILSRFIDRVKNEVAEYPGVYDDSVTAYLENITDVALEISIRFFTKTTEWHEFIEIQSGVNMKILDILDDMGIAMVVAPKNASSSKTANKA